MTNVTADRATEFGTVFYSIFLWTCLSHVLDLLYATEYSREMRSNIDQWHL